jgi:hypothetical protein
MVGNGNFSTKGTSKIVQAHEIDLIPTKVKWCIWEYIGNGLLVQMFYNWSLKPIQPPSYNLYEQAHQSTKHNIGMSKDSQRLAIN